MVSTTVYVHVVDRGAVRTFGASARAFGGGASMLLPPVE